MQTNGLIPQTGTTNQPTFINDIAGTPAEFISGFGFLPTLTNAANGNDVWPGTALTLPIPPQPGGQQMQLVSTSANDAGAGTGVQTVFVHYLDSSGNEQEEQVTMNGVTPVPTVATNIRFVQFMHSGTVGSNGAAVGTITISAFGTPATQYTLIQPGRNMSSNTARMVPAGKVCLITSFNAEGASNHFGDMHLRATTHEGVLLPIPVFVSQDNILCFNNASTHPYDPPILIPALAIIKVTGFTTDANGNFSASWFGMLVDTPT